MPVGAERRSSAPVILQRLLRGAMLLPAQADAAASPFSFFLSIPIVSPLQSRPCSTSLPASRPSPPCSLRGISSSLRQPRSGIHSALPLQPLHSRQRMQPQRRTRFGERDPLRLLPRRPWTQSDPRPRCCRCGGRWEGRRDGVADDTLPSPPAQARFKALEVRRTMGGGDADPLPVPHLVSPPITAG